MSWQAFKYAWTNFYHGNHTKQLNGTVLKLWYQSFMQIFSLQRTSLTWIKQTNKLYFFIKHYIINVLSPESVLNLTLISVYPHCFATFVPTTSYRGFANPKNWCRLCIIKESELMQLFWFIIDCNLLIIKQILHIHVHPGRSQLFMHSKKDQIAGFCKEYKDTFHPLCPLWCLTIISLFMVFS